jgi:hypothetical protein
LRANVLRSGLQGAVLGFGRCLTQETRGSNGVSAERIHD